jgi:hypothetical protein
MTAFMEHDSIGDVNVQTAAVPGREQIALARIERPGGRDRALMRRLTVGVSLGFFFIAAVASLDVMFSKKFYNTTGSAEWIWATHILSDGTPVVFFAARDFVLPANRAYARIKVLGDPEYTLYLNAVEIGGRRLGVDERHTVDLYDVSPIARDGRNRMVVAVRSANGVGGLIASIDVSPERENVVVTGNDWKIFRTWDPELLIHDPPGFVPSAPMLLGEPPMRRWNYLDVAPAAVARQPLGEAPVRGRRSFVTALPEFKTLGGVVVVGNERVRATAYDFGPITGWGRVTIRGEDRGVSRVVKVRYANEVSELRLIEGSTESFVFAPGERSVTDPQERRFRYMLIYGCCDVAGAQVIRSQ